MMIKSLKYLGSISLINVLVFIVLLLLAEGSASLLYVVYRTAQRSVEIAEVHHTTYDPLLGWVNLPDVFVKDMYGPGISLRTNAQGFRADRDYQIRRPANKIRLICSGDSFTLGYGVDNDHTWCHLLSALDRRIETINMGQGGYGVDQAFLWYMRDGTRLEHDVHVFAFITNDFERMQSNSFAGYNRPTLGLKDGEIVVNDLPASSSAFARLYSQLSQSRTFIALNALAARVRPELEDNLDLQQVVLHVFERLRQINAQEDSILILVYLPTVGDYINTQSDSWRRLLAGKAAQRGLLFIDLVEAFRRQSLLEVQTMFIGQALVNYTGGEGHYTVAGNEFVAHTLLTELLALREVQSKLALVAPTPVGG